MPDDELQRVEEQLRDARLVYDFGGGKVVGVAVRTARPFEWETIRFEGPVERVFRTAAIDLFTASVRDPAPEQATLPDEIATIAGVVLDAGRLVTIVYKAAIHTAAHSLMPGFAAVVVEHFAAGYDIARGQQTELVRKLTLGEIAAAVKNATAGLPEPARVDELRQPRVGTGRELRRMRGTAQPGSLPRPDTEVEKPPPPRMRKLDEPARRRRPELPDPGGL